MNSLLVKHPDALDFAPLMMMLGYVAVGALLLATYLAGRF